MVQSCRRPWISLTITHPTWSGITGNPGRRIGQSPWGPSHLPWHYCSPRPLPAAPVWSGGLGHTQWDGERVPLRPGPASLTSAKGSPASRVFSAVRSWTGGVPRTCQVRWLSPARGQAPPTVGRDRRSPHRKSPIRLAITDGICAHTTGHPISMLLLPVGGMPNNIGQGRICGLRLFFSALLPWFWPVKGPLVLRPGSPGPDLRIVSAELCPRAVLRKTICLCLVPRFFF